MKKLSIVILLLISSATFMFSQKNNKQRSQKKGANSEKVIQEMTTKLSLTQDQQEKIKTIIADNRASMKSNRQKYKGNKKCLAQSKYQTKKATEAKILAVLTPDQQTKFQTEKQLRVAEKKRKREEELSKPIDCAK